MPNPRETLQKLREQSKALADLFPLEKIKNSISENRKKINVILGIGILIIIVAFTANDVISVRSRKDGGYKEYTKSLGSLGGMVVDYVDGFPIQSASIAVKTNITTTDSGGNFQLNRVSFPVAELRVIKEGYWDSRFPVGSDYDNQGILEVKMVPRGRVVFVSSTEGSLRIKSINLDGADFKNVVPPIEGKNDFAPQVSENGQNLIFFSDREAVDKEKPDLYSMDLSSNLPRKLTNEYEITETLWVDNNRVIYLAINEKGKTTIRSVAPVKGSYARTVISPQSLTAGKVFQENPILSNLSVSADQQNVIFYAEHDSEEIAGFYTADLRGENLTKVSDPPPPDTRVNIPEYNLSAFMDPTDGKVYIADTEGAARREIANSEGTISIKIFGNGRYLLFAREFNGQNDIYVAPITNRNSPIKVTSFDPIGSFGTILPFAGIIE